MDSQIKDKLVSLKGKRPVEGLPEDVAKAVDTFIKQADILGADYKELIEILTISL